MQLPTTASLHRAMVCTEEFIRWKCADLPVPYLALLPTTCSLNELMKSEKEIRAKLAADVEAYLAEQASPWKKLGPVSHLLDRDGMSSDELLELGLGDQVSLGMPAAVKEGFEDHAEVVAARERAPRTAIYAADENVRELRRAASESAGGGKINAELKAAEAELRRLQRDPIAAMKIVRK